MIREFLWTIGSFFAFFPHEIHLMVSQFPHSWHVMFGLVLLLLSLPNSIFKMAIMAATIDATFHAVFTNPFETWVYFVVKVVLLVFLYSLRINVFITSGLFVLFFSIYYRSLEIAFGVPIGARVPDVLSVKFKDQPWLSASIWAAVHGVSALVPLLIQK